MKKFIKIAFVAAFAAVAGYGVYTSQKTDTMSVLALANVEALADSEMSNSNCSPSWNEECCFCSNIHYTYAYANNSSKSCETRKNCSHY